MAVAFGLLLLGCGAWAADWQQLTTNEVAARYVDTDSIRARADHVEAWILLDLAKPRRLDYPPFREYRSSRAMWAFDCRNRTSAVGQSMLYTGARGDGVVVSSTFDNTLTFESVEPGTLGAQALEFVCSYKPPANERTKSPARSK